ncbi:unnamed protein product [Lampetra fluviatilis]
MLSRWKTALCKRAVCPAAAAGRSPIDETAAAGVGAVEMRTEGRLRGLRAKASADPLEVVPTFWVTSRALPRRNVAPHARARRESTRKQFLMSPPTWFGGGASGSGLEGPKFKYWR